MPKLTTGAWLASDASRRELALTRCITGLVAALYMAAHHMDIIRRVLDRQGRLAPDQSNLIESEAERVRDTADRYATEAAEACRKGLHLA